MPFKDKDKQREYDRERMRKTRAKKKEKSSILEPIMEPGSKMMLNIISETDPVLLDILKDNPDMTADQVIRIYVRLMEGKKKKRDFSIMDIIPNWIFNKTDLQFIQAAGGGLSW